VKKGTKLFSLVGHGRGGGVSSANVKHVSISAAGGSCAVSVELSADGYPMLVVKSFVTETAIPMQGGMPLVRRGGEWVPVNA
jgi:hypothetical protein